MLTGWSRSDAIGRPLGEVFAVETTQGPGNIESIIATVMRSGVIFHLTRDYSLRMRSGRLLPIDDSIAPIRGSDERVEGVVVVFRDRTEFQRAEIARREFERRTHETQRLESLGLLAGGLAHDFNNLLAIIVGHASVEVELQSDPKELVESLNTIIEAGRRGAGLCAQLLAYAGKASSERTSVDVSVFATGMARLLGSSIPNWISVVLDLDPDAPCVTGDPRQLQQAISNLVQNAVDALGQTPGVITIRSRVESLDRVQLAQARVGGELVPGEYVFLEVSDNGPGVALEVLPRIFEPFFTSKRSGRGLGLSTVIGIVRGHGAGLIVDSVPGVGTTFRLFFEPRDLAASLSPSVSPAASWHGRGRVLVVDDEEQVARVAAIVLARLGFDTEVVVDPAEAWARFQASPDAYRLVVTDMTMPGMSGLEVGMRIRGLRPEFPIVLMSGYSAEDVAAHDQGFTIRVDKPFSAQMLRDAVRTALA